MSEFQNFGNSAFQNVRHARNVRNFKDFKNVRMSEYQNSMKFPK